MTERRRSDDVGGRSNTPEVPPSAGDKPLQRALKNSPVTAYAQDRDLRYIWTFNSVPGISSRWIIGKTDADLIAPEEAAALMSLKRRVIASGVGCRSEICTNSAIGVRYFDLTIEPLQDATGAIEGVTGTAIDITERKRAEEAFAESEQRYRDLFEQANDVVYVLDLNGTILAINRRLEEITGYRREDLIGASIEALILPEDLEHSRSMLGRKLGGAQETTYELRVRTRDGGARTLEISSRIVRRDGKNAEIHGVARDISERKRVLEALQVSRDQLQAILQSVADGVMVQNAQGKILYANEAAASMCGFPSVEVLLATPISEVLQRFTLLNQAGEPLPLDQLPSRRALRGEAAPEAVIRMAGQAGEQERWTIVRARAVPDVAGSPQFAVSAFQEITALHEREAEQRFLAEASRILTTSLDVATTLENVAKLATPEFADWCAVHLVDAGGAGRLLVVANRDSERAAWARELERRFPPSADSPSGFPHVIRTGQSELISDVGEVLGQEQHFDPEQLQLIRSADLRSSICAPLIAHGRTLGAITFVTGASGRRYTPHDLAFAEEIARRAAVAIENARLYEEAQRALTEAQTALALRDQFLSLASHELRTPLASLSGYLQLVQRRIERGDGPAALAPLIATAIGQSERLTGLVSDLLDISRLSTGRFVIERRTLAIAPLLQALRDAFQVANPACSIELMIQPDLPAIEGDLVRLEQALMNLLENAAKYAPHMQPVHLAAVLEREWVAISVQDAGIGIPPEDQAKIFDPFYRASNVDATKIGGLGLGLYLAREIASAHGGTLSVASQAGEGSTFTLRLPRERPSDAAE